MTKVVVIGLGAMGSNHVRALLDIPSVEVVGISDPNIERVNELSRKYKLPSFCDHKTLIKETKPDAAVLAVPTIFHKDMTIELLNQGIHVLVEKPIAFTVEEGQEMVDVAKRNGLVLGVGHIERFNPAVIELKKLLEQGVLGRLFMIHARRQSPFPRRIVDVGVGMDMATHELDMMYYLINSKVVHFSAEVSQVMQSATREDIIFSLLRFENGVLGILNVNWVTPTTVRELTITGERGMFLVNYQTQELCFIENPGAASILEVTNWESERNFTVEAGNMTRYQIAKREPLRSELEGFVNAVKDGAQAPVSGEDGLRALELAQQIVNSGNVSLLLNINHDAHQSRETHSEIRK